MTTQTETERSVYGNEALSIRKSNFPPDSTLSTGWLSQIPAAWVPYAQLMRLDRPNGLWYFYLPHLFGSPALSMQVPTSGYQLGLCSIPTSSSLLAQSSCEVQRAHGTIPSTHHLIASYRGLKTVPLPAEPSLPPLLTSLPLFNPLSASVS